MKPSSVQHYARQGDALERMERRKPHVYGGDPSVAGLRAFIRYHKDARQDVPIAGKMRSLTHKQVRMLGLFSRLEVTHEHATIRSMALEAHVAPSTVSRFILKVQAWGAYAVDVTRGKYGGVVIRGRQVGDGLADYAKRAWERIKKAADRAAFNVASRIRLMQEGYVQPENEYELTVLTTHVLMDATLNEAWDAAEARARVLADERRAEEAVATLGRPRGFDPGSLTAINVVAERRRLVIEDPAGEADAAEPAWHLARTPAPGLGERLVDWMARW